MALDYLERVFTVGTKENQRVLAVPVGEMDRIDLGEGVFALEQAYVGKAVEAGRWEAHDRHIDLQAIVAGLEKMEVCPRAQLTVEEDRLTKDDVCFLTDAGERSTWTVQAGEIAVFFPRDAHKPSLAAGEPVVIRKTCVKVEV